MAVDYKTLQAMAESQATDADGYCPECGQPVGRLVRASRCRATSRVGWPGILATLGLYLAVTFGVEAQGAQRLAAVRLEDLRQVASWCVVATGADPKCSEIAAARGLDPVLARLARYAAAEREARRDLGVATVGALATLAAIAAATRRLPQASNGERTPPWAQVLQRARDLLALGASALLPGAQLLLAASCSLALAPSGGREAKPVRSGAIHFQRVGDHLLPRHRHPFVPRGCVRIRRRPASRPGLSAHRTLPGGETRRALAVAQGAAPLGQRANQRLAFGDATELFCHGLDLRRGAQLTYTL
jgi:hypothetical protein